MRFRNSIGGTPASNRGIEVSEFANMATVIDGSTLRNLRLRAGRTQAEVAAAVGIPVTVLSAYERGRREPGVVIATRIVDALGFHLRFVREPDPALQAQRLADVLRLAEALPYTARPLHRARR